MMSFHYSKFGDFDDGINLFELEIKDIAYTARSASYLDLHLEIDSEGRLRTKQYDKLISISLLWTLFLQKTKDWANVPPPPQKKTRENSGAPEGKVVPAQQVLVTNCRW